VRGPGAAGLVTLACAVALVGASSSASAPPPPPITVTTNLDETDDNGQTSLREAMLQANATAAADTIVFDGNYTITLAGDLPVVTTKITVDASDGSRLVVVDGAASWSCFEANGKGVMTLTGFTVQHCLDRAVAFFGKSTGMVGEMQISDNMSDGVVITGAKVSVQSSLIMGNDFNGVTIFSSGNKVLGNYIGLNLAEDDHGNNGWGVAVGGTKNLVDGNQIGFNDLGGVLLAGVPGAAGNTVSNNNIGASVNSDLGNDGVGVEVDQPGAFVFGNLISGNSASGVKLQSSGAIVRQNRIGVNQFQSAALPNENYGVWVAGGVGPNAILNNVVSGNYWDGIFLEAPGTTVKGNFIGTTPEDGPPVPNKNASNAAANGITVAANATIGGTKPGEGNHIFVSDGNVAGIQTGSGAVATILGNTIGFEGQDNGNFGIWLNSSGNIVGPSKPGAGENVVIATDLGGIYVQGDHNLVQNNTLHDIGEDGIQVASGENGTGDGIGNRLLGNSVYNLQATQDAIDLFPNDTDANDDGDPDTGNNNLQNSPLLSGAAVSTKGWSVNMSLNSHLGRKYRIDVYGNSSGHCDDATRETERFLGSGTVSIKTGNVVIGGLKGKMPQGFLASCFVATATDLATGDTSEVGPYASLT
jgi:parallel beta-helix repeat protein